MRILLQLQARKLRDSGAANPKDYPFAKELCGILLDQGHELIQIGGDQDDQLVDNFQKGRTFQEVQEMIREGDTAICCDTFLQHACWYGGKKAIVIFGMSDPSIFGHRENLNLLKDRKYLRPNQFDLYYISDYNPNAFVAPEVVIDALAKLS